MSQYEAHVYTDAAYKNVHGKGLIGYAAAIYVNDEHVKTVKGNTDDEVFAASHNFAGELIAALAGVKTAVSLGYKYITVHHDNTQVANTVNRSHNDVLNWYIDELLSTGALLRFEHVRAHNGDKNNEYVDFMAKQALDELIMKQR